MSIKWVQSDGIWRADIANITLYASPDRSKFGKAARGTKWRAGVSSWDASTRTISRFGRDVYGQVCDSAKEAMKLAEEVYREAVAGNAKAVRNHDVDPDTLRCRACGKFAIECNAIECDPNSRMFFG